MTRPRRRFRRLAARSWMMFGCHCWLASSALDQEAGHYRTCQPWHPASVVACTRRGVGRTAFTLLEVVLALAIFFGAIAVLSQVTWNGTRAAVQAKLRGQALVRCEAVMQEVVAGAIPLSSQEGVTFEDDPTWSWSLVTQPTDLPELVFIEVTVAKSGGSSLSTATQTLRRWMRDPEVLVEAAREQAELQAELEASSSASGSGSGSGGNSSAGGGTR